MRRIGLGSLEKLQSTTIQHQGTDTELDSDLHHLFADVQNCHTKYRYFYSQMFKTSTINTDILIRRCSKLLY